MSKTLDISQVGQHLEAMLREATSDEEIVLTRDSVAIARVTPLNGANGTNGNGALPEASTPKPRVFGLHAGQGWMSDDFNDELPDEFWFGSELQGLQPDTPQNSDDAS